MQNSTPIVKDLVLVGGGHSHAIALLMFGMKPLPGVRITLITDTSQTPYSGMLPGHVAGFYSHDDCHIDLRPLAQFAQAQLYLDRAIGLDLANQRVLCANRPPVAYDILSIDIGSTPATLNVPGASEYAIPAKPVSKFLQAWDRLVENLDIQNLESPLRLGIVGGGAGGVELALNMQHRLQYLPEIHLFHRGAEVMTGHNSWVRQRLQNLLTRRGVKLHLQETVSEVQPNKIICESGLKVECDRLFWVTQASAPKWIRESGLATDKDGFIQVGDTLQSISHPTIFAAGDIAAMVNYSRPKSGVFAVRQGKPLFENLQRVLQGKSPNPFHPQKVYLSLIGTGDKSAIASWGKFGGQSSLLWHWKDRIDRQFMTKFRNLPEMQTSQNSKSQLRITNDELPIINPMRCAGCGSKVGSPVLTRVLQRLHPQTIRDDILIGLNAPDDAAVVQVPAGQVMLHTIDYFTSIINDPYIFGQIAANHCLSDLYAMGATPQSALCVATIPYGGDKQVEETLFQLLSGAIKVLQQANASLVGGHTTEGAELSLGLSCNGLASPQQLLKKGGMQPGQALILTKALGTGMLFAADMRRQAKGNWIDGAIASMLLSNQAAATCFLDHHATACTDITGFGLLGHLLEMVRASKVGVELDLCAIPILEGVREILEIGITSSLYPQNLQASQSIQNLAEVRQSPNFPILFDPQTSGGLLAAIPFENVTACLNSLQALGYSESRCIGQVTLPELGVRCQ